jgi:tRNA (guanine37-N1)-methyltransferase
MAFFTPPVHRSAAAVLDRALFSKTIPIAAARVTQNRDIARCRTAFEKSRDLLRLERLTSVRSDPDPAIASKGGRCLLLRPDIQHNGSVFYSVKLYLLMRKKILQRGVPSCKKPWKRAKWA